MIKNKQYLVILIFKCFPLLPVSIVNENNFSNICYHGYIKSYETQLLHCILNNNILHVLFFFQMYYLSSSKFYWENCKVYVQVEF